MIERLVETTVPIAEAADTQSRGRGIRQSQNGARPDVAGDDSLWQQAYEESLARGAGANAARYYADQKLLYVRRDRDGTAIAGERDYTAYR